MKFPNKVTPYQKSIMAKFMPILVALKAETMSPARLYSTVKKHVSNVGELVDILTCLYALNKIDLIDGEVLVYVEDDWV